MRREVTSLQIQILQMTNLVSEHQELWRKVERLNSQTDIPADYRLKEGWANKWQGEFHKKNRENNNDDVVYTSEEDERSDVKYRKKNKRLIKKAWQSSKVFVGQVVQVVVVSKQRRSIIEAGPMSTQISNVGAEHGIRQFMAKD